MNSSKILKGVLGIIIIAIIVGLLILLPNKRKKETTTIGILQLMDHKALDDARRGFEDVLKESGIEVDVDVKNANGDIANTNLIANKFVSDDVDVIFAIATPAAQAAKQATLGKDIPVLFTAVTDPVYSELVNNETVIDGNITGVKDQITTEKIKEMFEVVKTLKNEKNAIGIIYNTGESNSEIQVEEAKQIAGEIGMTIETVGITNMNDIPQAINTLSNKVDGLYITTDNLVANSISLVAKTAKEKGLLTISADDSGISEGIMYADGINYYELGRQTGIMAKRLLVDKIDITKIHIEEAKIYSKKINKATIESLGLDVNHSVFEGAEIVEE